MNIQYINKENHEVIDDRSYLFHENEIKLVPDRLGQYLCSKYSQSFICIEDSLKEPIVLTELNEKPITATIRGMNSADTKKILNQLEPTKRFMIEPSLVCNIKCKFCYHLHRYDTWKDTVKTLDEMKNKIDQGIDRGNKWVDITGGEPSIYPDIIELIEYIKLKELKVCIITNGIIGKIQTDRLLNVGVDEFLVSRQGRVTEHNFITNTDDGYSKQVRFLKQIKDKVSLRFNCVIHQYNQDDLEAISICLSKWNPKIVNFINMNLHHEWKNKELEAKEVIADLRKIKKQLNKAIEYLENKHIGINVRYYPMCQIDEKYRRCICNDLHVMFDPYEWDYETLPKTNERYYEWGKVTSNNNEEKGKPCNECDLQNICGGINKYFHKVSNDIYGEVCKPQKVANIDKMDYNMYRKDNKLTI